MASRVFGFFRRAVGVVAGLVMVGWVVCLPRVGVGQVADPLAPPANRVGVREEVRFVALVGGTVHVGPGRVVEGGTVVLRGGLVEGVLEAGVAVPAGAEVRDVRGRYVYPALIDAYVEVDGPAVAIDGPGAHWSPVVLPQGDVLDGPGLSEKDRDELRGLGFGAANIVPRRGVFRGRSAVVSLADVGKDRSASRGAVYKAASGHVVAFETDGGGGSNTARWESYPDSQMGAIALIRQTLLDAGYRKARLGAGLEGGVSALDALDTPSPLLMVVGDELEVLRAGKIAREAGRGWIVRGSGMEFERLEAVAGEKGERGWGGLIVPVNFPEPPRVGTVSEANSVDLRTLMAWEQAPTNPRRLVEAGVEVALTGDGLKDRGVFMERVRLAVRHGLKEEDALAALTTVPAKMLGVEKQLGTLEVGKRANVIVTDKPLFARGSRVLEAWTDGLGDEIKADLRAMVGLYAMGTPGGGGAVDGEVWGLRIDEDGGAAVLRWKQSEPGEKVEGDAKAEGGAKASEWKLATSVGKSVVIERGRVSLTFENKAFGPAGVWSLMGLSAGSDEQGRVIGLRGDGRRADGSMFVWEAKRDARTPWLGVWRVIEGDGKVIGAEDSRQVRLEISPGVAGGGAGLDVKVRFVGFDKKDGQNSESVDATGEAFAGGVLTYAHDLKAVGAEGVSEDRVVLEEVGGRVLLRGMGVIRVKGAAEVPHRFVAARDEGEAEALADAPKELPGLPFGAYAVKVMPAQERVALVNATVWTCGPAGVIENGTVLVSGGKIEGVLSGKVEVPAGYRVVDCAGKHITPGIVDCHSHTGISNGVNEAGQAVTAEVRIGDVTNPDSVSWYRQLAGGVTTVNSLHGSANVIGGQNQVNKNRWGAARPDDLHFAGAVPGIKFALGENVKQSNWGDAYNWRYPQTRMGVEGMLRDRFTAAREYDVAKAAARGAGVPFRVDLELEALAEVLRGERLVHCHSYRQDEVLMLARVAKEFGFKLGTYQHILEGYKVADAVRESSGGGSCFADWWGYKVEVQDAIPQAGPIMHEQGVVVSFNSDSDEMARRMNVEGGKAYKYSLLPDGSRSVSKEEALKFVTLNPARQLRVDGQVGSIEVGKDADVVVWSGEPLSPLVMAERTFVDGRELWSRERDAALRAQNAAERTRLVQKVLAERTRRPAVEKVGEGKPAEVKPGAGPGGLIVRMRADADWLLERVRMERLRRGKDAEAAVAGECGCDAP